MNYDPNLTNSGRMAKQTVVLTFAMWTYQAKHTTTVGGNCRGLTVIESAVDNVYESLPYTEFKGESYSRIILTDEEGDTLECEDEDGRGDEWLKDMLISAEIIEIVPEEEK